VKRARRFGGAKGYKSPDPSKGLIRAQLKFIPQAPLPHMPAPQPPDGAAHSACFGAADFAAKVEYCVVR
jgi:hypothetical protein